MEFRILGPLEMTGAAGTAALGGSREGALLARLLLSVNRVVSCERLVDDLWETEAPGGAPRALQVYVSRLRKALRGCGIDDVLLTRSPGYVLALEADVIDAARFEALVAMARELSERGDHRAAAETLRSALALWRGSALAGVDDAPFARAEAVRLEEGRLAAVEERIEADLACGRHGELIGELAALVSEHPLRERLWSQRMVALYRADRQAEALRSYQELRRVLGEELGIEPSAGLRRLESAILRHDPELDWAALEAPAAGYTELEAEPSAPPAASGAVVTFLFTDVVGSTGLLEELGEDEAEELRRRHFALLRKAVADHGGTEVKSLGDGLMVAFDSPLAGLGCAVAMQRALHAPGQGQARTVPARIGLHAGEPLREDEDFFGTPVVIAKRLCDEAEGGQILVSALLRDLIGRRGGHTFRDLGGLSLKGLAEPVATYEAVWSTTADADLSPPAASRPALPLPLGREGRVPLVGRDEELARLEAAWSAAASGERRVVLVAGEPGIGKSRLAADVARRAHTGGGVVCFGRCDEGMGVPYQPFVEALGGYVRAAPAPVLGRLAGELVRLVPEVTTRVPGLPSPLRSDPETERYRLFDAVAAWLAAASESAPVLLVVDDLHWATTPTLQLLRHLARSGETLALLAVVTYRDTAMDVTEDLADLVAELLREPGVERLGLSGLDEAGVAAFMEARAGHGLDDDGRAFAAVLHAETAGNPFFVGEVLAHLTEHGAIVRRRGRWGAGRPLSEMAVPEGVAELVGRRLSRLPDETNEVLTLAAVMGERFELPALVEASGMPEIATTRALDPALAARLVHETGVGRYQFAHALVRSTLEESLGPTRRAALHAAAGQAVETVHAGDRDPHLAELAHHFIRAENHTKGLDYASRAGDHALALLAHHEAANHYTQALELLDRAGGAGDEPRRCDLLLSLGEAQRRAGEPAFRQTLLDAARLAQGPSDAERQGGADRLAAAALGLSRSIMLRVGHVDEEVVRVLEAAVDAVGPEDSPVRARLLANLALNLSQSANFPRLPEEAGSLDPAHRLSLSDEALAIARRLGDPATLVLVLTTRIFAAYLPGAVDQRIGETSELVVEAERLGDPAALCQALAARYRALMETDAIEEANRCLDRYAELAEDLRRPTFRWTASWALAGRAFRLGRIEEGERLWQQAFETGQSAGEPDAPLFKMLGTREVALVRGSLVDIEPAFAELAGRFPHFAVLHAFVAEVYAETGRLAEAQAILERLAAANFRAVGPDSAWPWAMAVLAVVANRCGDRTRAEMIHNRLAPFAAQYVFGGGLASGCLAHYLGLLTTTLERFDEAEQRFAAAATAHERIEAPVWTARTRLEWARMLLQRNSTGDAERARSLLQQALATATELGLGGVERQAQALLDGRED